MSISVRAIILNTEGTPHFKGGFPDPYLFGAQNYRATFRDVRSTKNIVLPMYLWGIRETEEKMQELLRSMPKNVKMNALEMLTKYLCDVEEKFYGMVPNLPSPEDVIRFAHRSVRSHPDIMLYAEMECHFYILWRMTVDEKLELDKEAYVWKILRT